MKVEYEFQPDPERDGCCALRYIWLVSIFWLDACSNYKAHHIRVGLAVEMSAHSVRHLPGVELYRV